MHSIKNDVCGGACLRSIRATFPSTSTLVSTLIPLHFNLTLQSVILLLQQSQAYFPRFTVLLHKNKMTRPSTCCGQSTTGCICAAQARCECGKTTAEQCNCSKKAVHDPHSKGARCSCRMFSVFSSRFIQNCMADCTGVGMRPAGQCTCERSVTENRPVDGDACACGQRPAGMFISFLVDSLEVSPDNDSYRIVHMRKSRANRCRRPKRIGDGLHHESLICFPAQIATFGSRCYVLEDIYTCFALYVVNECGVWDWSGSFSTYHVL